MKHRIKFIGLTGGIGAGKSALTKILQDFGLDVIQADQCVHEALSQDQGVKDQIKAKFGPAVFDSEGAVMRRELGKIVFKSEDHRLWLEQLLHPKVRQRVEKLRDQLEKQGKKVLFYEVPLLFEKGLGSQFDEIWLVTAPESIRTQRVIDRDHLTEDEVRLRLQSQLPQDQKIKLSDRVFENSKGLGELKAQALDTCRKLGFIES